jgi:DNA polymerase-3 subunit alpha
MPETAARALWDQMAEFAKYSFNRAHAFAYAIIAYWCAWLKFHYPAQFLVAVLSTLDKDKKDRIPAFITEARRMGYAVLPPDINASGNDFTSDGLAVRYGFSALSGIGKAGREIESLQPFSSYEDFIERVIANKETSVDRGQLATLARIGAFDSLVPNRHALVQKIANDKSGESTRCQFKDESVPVEIRPFNPTPNKDNVIGERLPCTFDWESLPVILGRTNKPLKDQSKRLPARKCTKACSQYVSVPDLDPDQVPAYTDYDIRTIEHEMLGVYLSSTPFDTLDPNDREECRVNAESMEGGADGVYLTAGLVTKVEKRQTKGGESFGRVTIETEGGTYSTSAFDLWRSNVQPRIVEGVLAIVEIRRQTKGQNIYFNLNTFIPVG